MAAAEPNANQPLRHPPSLSLPPSQFARLQPHAYLLAHLSPPSASNQPSIRANGRTPSQFRATSTNVGSLTHTNGSAVVRIGDTAAVCGVRAEILHTDDIPSWSVSTTSTVDRLRALENENYYDDSHIQDLNLLVPNLSLSTGCAPGFVPGAPPSTLAQSLSHQLLSLLHTSHLIQEEDLRIWYQHPNFPGGEAHNDSGQMDIEEEQQKELHGASTKQEIKAFWVLYIDIMVISLAGNLFDTAWTALLAALKDTKLPRAWWDADNEMVVCSDSVSEARKLSLRGLPVASSFCTFEADAAASWRAVVIPDEMERQKGAFQNRWILADPDGYEESLSQERILVVVDKDREGNGKTSIIKMEKNGGWSVGREELRQLVDLSAQRWEQIRRVLDF